MNNGEILSAIKESTNAMLKAYAYITQLESENKQLREDIDAKITEAFSAGRTIIDYDPNEVIHNAKMKYRNVDEYLKSLSPTINIENEETI
jgi:hypothetical protein